VFGGVLTGSGENSLAKRLEQAVWLPTASLGDHPLGTFKRWAAIDRIPKGSPWPP